MSFSFLISESSFPKSLSRCCSVFSSSHILSNSWYCFSKHSFFSPISLVCSWIFSNTSSPPRPSSNFFCSSVISFSLFLLSGVNFSFSFSLFISFSFSFSLFISFSFSFSLFISFDSFHFPLSPFVTAVFSFSSSSRHFFSNCLFAAFKSFTSSWSSSSNPSFPVPSIKSLRNLSTLAERSWFWSPNASLSCFNSPTTCFNWPIVKLFSDKGFFSTGSSPSFSWHFFSNILFLSLSCSTSRWRSLSICSPSVPSKTFTCRSLIFSCFNLFSFSKFSFSALNLSSSFARLPFWPSSPDFPRSLDVSSSAHLALSFFPSSVAPFNFSCKSRRRSSPPVPSNSLLCSSSTSFCFSRFSNSNSISFLSISFSNAFTFCCSFSFSSDGTFLSTSIPSLPASVPKRPSGRSPASKSLSVSRSCPRPVQSGLSLLSSPAPGPGDFSDDRWSVWAPGSVDNGHWTPGSTFLASPFSPGCKPAWLFISEPSPVSFILPSSALRSSSRALYFSSISFKSFSFSFSFLFISTISLFISLSSIFPGFPFSDLRAWWRSFLAFSSNSLYFLTTLSFSASKSTMPLSWLGVAANRCRSGKSSPRPRSPLSPKSVLSSNSPIRSWNFANSSPLFSAFCASIRLILCRPFRISSMYSARSIRLMLNASRLKTFSIFGASS